MDFLEPQVVQRGDPRTRGLETTRVAVQQDRRHPHARGRPRCRSPRSRRPSGRQPAPHHQVARTTRQRPGGPALPRGARRMRTPRHRARPKAGLLDLAALIRGIAVGQDADDQTGRLGLADCPQGIRESSPRRRVGSPVTPEGCIGLVVGERAGFEERANSRAPLLLLGQLATLEPAVVLGFQLLPATLELVGRAHRTLASGPRRQGFARGTAVVKEGVIEIEQTADNGGGCTRSDAPPAVAESR